MLLFPHLPYFFNDFTMQIFIIHYVILSIVHFLSNLDTFFIRGQHGGSLVSTFASQQESFWWALAVWNLHGFLQSTDMQVR